MITFAAMKTTPTKSKKRAAPTSEVEKGEGLSMKRAVLLVVLGLALASTGCLHMNIRTIRPAPNDLGPIDTLVLVQGQGRADALQIVATQVAQQVGGRGFMGVEDARSSSVRITSTGPGAQLQPAPDAEARPTTAYLRIDVEEWSAAPTVATRTHQNDQGLPITQVIPIIRGRARIRAIILAPDGKTVMLSRSYEGGADMDVVVPPPPAAEIAGGNAVSFLVNEITPIIVTESVRIDKSDRGQRGYIELANAGNIAGAADGLQQYVDANPNNAVAHYNLAVMLDAIRQYEAALQHYDQAIQLHPKGYYVEARQQCAGRLALAQ